MRLPWISREFKIGKFIRLPVVLLSVWYILSLTGFNSSRNAPTSSQQSCRISITSMTDSGIPRNSLNRNLPLRPVHIMLIGHSRFRQIYEVLTARLGLTRRTRADPAPRMADLDALGEESLLLQPSSTCLAGFEHLRNSRNWWCSQAADLGETHLEHRWRRDRGPLVALLSQLVTADIVPDVMFVTYGLYLLVLPNGSKKSWQQLEELRSDLLEFSRLLVRVQRRGVQVFWVLEHSPNSYVLDQPTLEYRLGVINTLALEVMLKAGVAVWSGHLPVTVDWSTRICRLEEEVQLTNNTRESCDNEVFHLDDATLHKISHQFWDNLLCT